jgi:hypothetical protein
MSANSRPHSWCNIRHSEGFQSGRSVRSAGMLLSLRIHDLLVNVRSRISSGTLMRRLGKKSITEDRPQRGRTLALQVRTSDGKYSCPCLSRMGLRSHSGQSDPKTASPQSKVVNDKGGYHRSSPTKRLIGENPSPSTDIRNLAPGGRLTESPVWNGAGLRVYAKRLPKKVGSISGNKQQMGVPDRVITRVCTGKDLGGGFRTGKWEQ